MAATPALLPGESQGRGSLAGCGPWGRTESGTTEATQQQQRQQQRRNTGCGAGRAMSPPSALVPSGFMILRTQLRMEKRLPAAWPASPPAA